jgi:hypothetical protein
MDPSPRFTASATAAHTSGGKVYFRSANAYSAISQAEAHAAAKALARERAQAAAAHRYRPTQAGEYPYPDRPIVEPVLARLDDPVQPGRELARLTRNAYHATVLNAYDVLFVDVDTTADTSNSREEKPVPQDTALSARAADAVHARFQQREPLGRFAMADQVRSHDGRDLGSRYYPRVVTACLWLRE